MRMVGFGNDFPFTITLKNLQCWFWVRPLRLFPRTRSCAQKRQAHEKFRSDSKLYGIINQMIQKCNTEICVRYLPKRKYHIITSIKGDTMSSSQNHDECLAHSPFAYTSWIVCASGANRIKRQNNRQRLRIFSDSHRRESSRQHSRPCR